jgi:uncharacterized protein
MPLIVNLRHLEDEDLSLKDELPVAELDLAEADELIHAEEPLIYDLEVHKLDKGLLIQGSLRLTLKCECARCLKSFQHHLVMEEWTCHLPLEGEEKVEVVNDCVDLTPYIREDILLAFPQQPLCEPECKGLPVSPNDQRKAGAGWEPETVSPTWDELKKLKF